MTSSTPRRHLFGLCTWLLSLIHQPKFGCIDSASAYPAHRGMWIDEVGILACKVESRYGDEDEVVGQGSWEWEAFRWDAFNQTVHFPFKRVSLTWIRDATRTKHRYSSVNSRFSTPSCIFLGLKYRTWKILGQCRCCSPADIVLLINLVSLARPISLMLSTTLCN